MNLAKHHKRYLLSLGVGLLFQTVNAETTNDTLPLGGADTNRVALSDWVILPAEVAATNRGFPENFEPLWNPTTNHITEAIRCLLDYLQRMQTNGQSFYTNQLPGIRERLPRTACQFVGVSFEKRKVILLNCIPANHGFSRDWENRFVKVYDGGPRWWSVIYLPDEKEFTRLRVDLGF